MMVNHRTSSVLIALFVAALASTALAQVSGGALIGRISDERDAPIARVDVTATHVATGLTRTLKTDRDGRYRFPSLPTGVYEVAAEQHGYATVSVRKIDVLLGVARHVDIRMKHVTEEEELTVTAPVRAVESGPAIGITVRRDLIADVPLRRRSINELAALAPMTDPFRRRPLAETIIDGAVGNEDLPLDSVAELHAVARQYPAEFGRASGGVLLATTRKGTNEIDGDAFALYGSRSHDWQWGVAAGGPVVKDTSHAFAAIDGGDRTRAFANANIDLASRHFIEAEYANRRNSGTVRDLWLARGSVWNELVARAASHRNEINEMLSGSFGGTLVRHNWTAGALAIENGGHGYFAQDQIVINKTTVNAGVRYDSGSGFSPRVGWMYDINGSGRNLLRASFGRYRDPGSNDVALGYAWQVNPWVALNVDGLHSNDGQRSGAVSGVVMFSAFVSLAGSYAYSDHNPSARHTAAVAGTLHLPGGFWLSGIGRYRSATRAIDRLAGTDVRVAKNFTFERFSVDAIADAFNVFDQSGAGRSGRFGFRVNF